MSPRRGEVLLGRWRTSLSTTRSSRASQSRSPRANGCSPFTSIRGAPHRIVRNRAFKTRELALLIEFYLERAERYGAISQEAADEARYFVPRSTTAMSSLLRAARSSSTSPSPGPSRPRAKEESSTTA